ncbi:autophagy-related protein 2 isoform X2 [Argentina anserina]|uniref:autophagy-related protein 2 isoform X2 n=1 Tax=Argentina anserina TaxID=57926 RepID=UPI0021764FA2|nr:autophagy-related protein 2 isoform X2 [Potentilla anserina]
MWNIAKSAEAMFSRWAVKRVCKFVLKKKLGHFILGDIDVDQLDVQFADGTIQLTDLALNVDFLNHKIGAASSVMIKEGSIGSLLVRMPWKGNGCEVEVNELELVLVPCTDKSSPARAESGNQNQDSSNTGKFDGDMLDNAAKSTRDVHEGVKTIAKMVKWLLTSFHIRIKKLIVAFDPCLEKNGKTSGSLSTLVLRISEAECGTGVSEDANQNVDSGTENFLGNNQLTTFVKFQGAVLELLQMDNDDNQKCNPRVTERTYGDFISVGRPPGVTTPIMIGKGGGFSGNLKLTIPWKNGSLDIRKVDADAFIEPVELRFQPSTIKWVLLASEVLKSLERDQSNHTPTDSIFLDSASHFGSVISAYSAADTVTPVCGNLSAESSSLTFQESVTGLLPGSHVISDWVPYYMNKNKSNGMEEIDFGASVDQFFECFDGMRSSQSALGSSGMWNWTRSVVSAITAVSSLASGSLHVAHEQQPVETNLRATLAGISVLFPFQDEHQNINGDLGSSSDVLYLSVESREILLVMQVSSRHMSFEGTMDQIEVASYSSHKNSTLELGLQGCNKVNSQTSLIHHLQDDVQSVLPLHASSYNSAESNGFAAEGFPFGYRDDLVRITLLKTSGVASCQCTVSCSSSDGSSTRPTSFSLKLPHFVLWVDFSLLHSLSELLKEIGKTVEVNNQAEFSMEALNKNSGSPHRDLRRASSCVTTLSSTDSVRGDIFIPNARIILCLRSNGGENARCFSSWDQFIVLEFTSPSNCWKGTIQDHGPSVDASSEKRYSSTVTRSLQLNVGDLDVFLVSPLSKDNAVIRSGKMPRLKLTAQRVISVTNRKGRLSVISMLWQEGYVTGPWMAKKAKCLATLDDSRRISKFVGKDHEFASVSTVKDVKDLSSQTRQEIILSSAFFLHICLPAVTIKLDNPQYKELCHLFDQVMNDISSVDVDSIDDKKESSMPQTSVLVDCDSVEILINLDVKETVQGSMQSELPGTWSGLRLKVQKLEILSVSNIGGIRGAKFFWLAHDEGKLWGSITSIPDHEFLLITCSNSTMKRGDGGGSNALSSRLAGSDIVHLWDPTDFHSSTSITVRCATIIAVGGRLDWPDALCSFFVIPAEIDQAEEKCNKKDDAPCGSSFVLNLVDIGLSYEPYQENMVVRNEDSMSSYSSVKGTGEEYVSCVLAASSLNLSTSTVAESAEMTYNIRVQDLGLLLRVMSKPEDIRGAYSAEHLHKIGYVKVAREALVEANLRMNCKNGLLWEVECSKSHIFVETCHDTMSSLIRLAAQIQQLFAPDMEESFVHLQTRWNKFQQEQERRGFADEIRISDSDSPTAQLHTSGLVTGKELPSVGLMDEISEDAFRDYNHTNKYDSSESQIGLSSDEDLGEACYCRIGTPDVCLPGPSHDGSSVESESSQTSFLQEGNVLQLIEGYCLSELRPLSELSVGRQSSPEIVKSKSKNARFGGGSKENHGWYGTSANILEDHIPKMSGSSKEQTVEDTLPSTGSTNCNDVGKAIGRVLLKNIDVRWRMLAGSDWQDSRVTGQRSGDFSGRDATVCLECSLCGMDFQYDVYPVGGVCVSKLSLSVQDFYLYDKSKDAPWKLVLGYYHSKDRPRKSSSKGFKLDLEAVRPDPLTPLEEYRLRVAFLPMLLHLHQCQLDFLIGFFGSKSSSVDQSSGCYQDSDGSNALPKNNNNLAGHAIAEEAFLPYFQKFDIWPILVRVDYSPSRIDLAALRGGKYVELVNLVPWKGVELQLKHVHAVGIYGWGSVGETIIGEWLEEISQNQIHKILRGLPTIRSLVAVGTGAAKMVSLPVEQYKKDKRVLKGMQRGTIAFLRSISLEAVGLGVHLAAGTHDVLLQAECLLTSVPPSVPWSAPHRVKSSARSNQPKDAQHGIHQAYESLSDGLGRSASALVRTPLKKYQRGAGAGSALASAVRAVPAAAIAPASACASAVHCALLGFRNSLDPERKKESMEKYLGPPQPWEQN